MGDMYVTMNITILYNDESCVVFMIMICMNLKKSQITQTPDKCDVKLSSISI